MAQKKYYAIKQGRETGVFDNWNECNKHIKGFSGAIYKSFSTYQEAHDFVNGGNSNIENTNSEVEVEAYVDGSYMNEYRKYSYGCVILHQDEVIRLADVGNVQEYVEMRNVAGELLGAMKAIEWAYEHKCKSIMIYHDYEGIERWANGHWKANKQGTQEYVEFIKNYKKYIDIRFTKVRAHSGDVYNEEADQLAKKAIMGEIKDGLVSREKVKTIEASSGENSKENPRETPRENAVEESKRSSLGDLKDNSVGNTLDKKIEIFKKVMKTKEKKKNAVEMVFKDYSISEGKLIKFAKEIWQLEGYEKDDFDTVEMKFNIKDSKIEWVVTNKEGNQKDFDIQI